ncbi:MAG: alpha-1,3-fucosyltransferase [Proteobacteria bacterium]|nr:alpha-1,3-fucosyltransferase [Pseudomonadota bacterium]
MAADASTATMRVLVYNDDWTMLPPAAEWPPGCAALYDRRQMAAADVVLFHLPTLVVPGTLHKRPGQRWVAWSMESAAHVPFLDNPACMRPFDWTMTHRRDADVWVPYLLHDAATTLRQPPVVHDADAPVACFISSPRDHSGRGDYLAALMAHIDIHSHGTQRRNRALAGDGGAATKLATIARYPFTLAFENAVERDYVTEKFFQPLTVGSVPVYLGAPNVADFAPGERSYIDTRDFADPAALAAHLRALLADPAAYAAHLAWKTAPLRAAFMTAVSAVREHALARLRALWLANR